MGLKYHHISEGARKTLKTIVDRKSGELKSLKTSKEALNKALMDGID